MAVYEVEQRVPFWRDHAKRSIAFQVLVLGALFILGYQMFSNAVEATRKQSIASGFGFLGQEASFEIADSLIPYSSQDTFGRAFLVGLLNTLALAFFGNLLAVIWGAFSGIVQLSKNYLLSGSMKVYINIARNIPLLLQLFFWYTLITEMLPSVRNAVELMPSFYFSQRGVFLPRLVLSSAHLYVLLAGLLGVLAVIGVYFWQKKQKTPFPLFRVAIALIVFPPLIVWPLVGAPVELEIPVLKGFNFEGGYSLGPELITLLLGLVLYTGAFIAEIVRSGIQSVDKGQWEAAASLGLGYRKTLRLVVLPQALRVIIPPLTSQMLNLTKNSSLAVAVGFSDVVNVANTTLNQTGQAVECILLIMVVYLSLSLLTSLFMNWYNHATRLKGR